METADNASVSEPKKQWVKFEEDSPENANQQGIGGSAAIIEAETTQINIDKNRTEPDKKATAVITPETVHINVNRPNVSRPVQPEPRLSKVPENKGVLKNVDLREVVNGRPAPITNSGLSNVSNAVIRQGFGMWIAKQCFG